MKINIRGLIPVFCMFYAICAFSCSAQETQLPAFPGAEGFGAQAVGGRGGKVVHVTNLKSSGPGSFQWACDQPGPSIVVFDVSGVIESGARIKHSNTYIAGQTAPGAGITFQGRLMAGGLHDIIIRFLRCRPMYGHGGGGSGDCTQLGGINRMILDHVSVSWGNDENMDFCGCKNLTVQWCAIEESRIGHEKSCLHNYGMIMGYVAGDATLHHNLFAHHSERAPLCGLDTLDHRNNVIYNVEAAIQYHPTSMNRRGKRRYRLNLVGCYFKDGHAGPIGVRPWMQPHNRTHSGISDWKNAQVYGKGNYWTRTGGYHDYNPEMEKTQSIDSKFRTATPWEVPPVATHTAEEAYKLVCAHAGCIPRDAVSKRMIHEVRTGTGYWGRRLPDGGLIEGLKPGTPPADTDRDGMPDTWEKAHGLDPASPDDAVKTVPAGASKNDRHKGYTYIEFYINELAEKHVKEAIAADRKLREGIKPEERPERPKIGSLDPGNISIPDRPIAAGAGHTLAKTDSALWGWGLNWRGELGDGTGRDSNVPVKVKIPDGNRGLADAVCLSSSGAHVMALQKDGSLFGWGFNRYGQLGCGTAGDQQLEPVQVKGQNGEGFLKNVAGVSAGGYHTLAVCSDGSVWAWGSNLEGRLGDGTEKERHTPVQVKEFTGVTAVAAGIRHSAALRSDGTVCVWGDNLYGAIGDGTNIDSTLPVLVPGIRDAKAIAAGWHHTMVLRKNGTVLTFGCNHYGQLGDGTEQDRNKPVQVQGPGGQGVLSGVVSIAAGGLHSLALRSDGTLWAWGWNYCSQIGDGTRSWSRSTPVQVKGIRGKGVLTNVKAFDGGGAHSTAVLDDGTVLSWGNNGRGQNGLGWTGSICAMDGKFISYDEFRKKRLHTKGARNVFGPPWPVKVNTGKLPVLVFADNLENGETWLRVKSALNLAHAGPGAIDALDSLIKALKDENATVRKHSAWAISKLGPAAKAAIPALKEALDDPDKGVVFNVKQALKKIQGE